MTFLIRFNWSISAVLIHVSQSISAVLIRINRLISAVLIRFNRPINTVFYSFHNQSVQFFLFFSIDQSVLYLDPEEVHLMLEGVDGHLPLPESLQLALDRVALDTTIIVVQAVLRIQIILIQILKFRLIFHWFSFMQHNKEPQHLRQCRSLNQQS